MKHFQACKDCAADEAILIATQDSMKNDVLVLTLAAFKLFSDDPDVSTPNNLLILLTIAQDEDTWDEEDTIAQAFADEHTNEEPQLPVFTIEPNDEIILSITKEWITKIIARYNVCPFTLVSY